VLTAQEFPGLYHELFNEPERAEVLGHLTRWLALRAAG
jgi:acylglycerol lipase